MQIHIQKELAHLSIVINEILTLSDAVRLCKGARQSDNIPPQSFRFPLPCFVLIIFAKFSVLLVCKLTSFVPFLQTKNFNNRCYNQKVAAFNLGVSEAVKVFPNINFLIFSHILFIIQEILQYLLF